MRIIAFLSMLMFCVQARSEDVRVIPGIEGLQQLEEAGIKSRLKFRNAEAIVTRTSETQSADPALAGPGRKVQLFMRVTLDFEQQRCSYVVSRRLLDKADAKDPVHYSYVLYRDGKGTDNIGVTIAEPGREGFFKYMGENDVWHVELAGVGFNQNNAVWSPEKNSETELQRLQKYGLTKSDKLVSSTRIHPNGNKEFIREWTNTSNKDITVFHPKFELPIERIAIGPVNGKVEELVHTKVDFEDVDGFTRCKSSIREMLTRPHPDTLEKVHSTAQYQWLQFNEDKLEWPDEQQVISSDGSMQAYLENKN